MEEAVGHVLGAEKPPPSPPPDGGYGWVCLFAYFCVNAFTWGVVAASTSRVAYSTSKC